MVVLAYHPLHTHSFNLTIACLSFPTTEQ
jgi:hypothetical protein